MGGQCKSIELESLAFKLKLYFFKDFHGGGKT
jgi:hypothetical protein